MNVFELFAKISLDSTDYENQLNDAGEKTSSFADKLKNGLGSAAKIGSAAFGALTVASGALVSATAKGVSDVAAYGDNIDKMSQKMGLSAEAYQEWDAVMQHSGTSIESLQAGMKTLANAVESGNKAFERLGISQEEIANMNNEELFSATITALQNVENETERTYLAGQLLGRGATELGALLNTSAEDTQKMKDRVHELGGVMSDESVKAAAAFQDSLQDLKTGISGISRGLLSEFLPAITQIMDGLAMVITGEAGGADAIASAVDSFASGITDMVPRVMEIGGEFIDGLITAIIGNLPKIVEVGGTVIMELAVGIGDSLPELIPLAVNAILQLVEAMTSPDTLSNLIDAAIAIIIALSEGLIMAIPELIKAVPTIIKNLIEAIIENQPKLAAAALELIIALGTGLVASIPELLSYVIKVPSAILGGIKDGLVGIVEIGPDLIKGLWEGIKSMGSWLTDKVTGFFTGIVDSVKSLLGIHSPSKVFAGIGENMAYGLGEGWGNQFGKIKRDIQGSLEFKPYALSIGTSGFGMTGNGNQRYGETTTYNYYNMTIDAKNIQSLNDLVTIAQNQRIATRMGVS